MDNMQKYQTNSGKHSLKMPSMFQILISLATRKVWLIHLTKQYNALPSNTKILNHNMQVFKPALKHYPLTPSFHSIEESFSTGYSYIHTYIHAYIHTYINTYIFIPLILSLHQLHLNMEHVNKHQTTQDIEKYIHNIRQ